MGFLGWVRRGHHAKLADTARFALVSGSGGGSWSAGWGVEVGMEREGGAGFGTEHFAGSRDAQDCDDQSCR